MHFFALSRSKFICLATVLSVAALGASDYEEKTHNTMCAPNAHWPRATISADSNPAAYKLVPLDSLVSFFNEGGFQQILAIDCIGPTVARRIISERDQPCSKCKLGELAAAFRERKVTWTALDNGIREGLGCSQCDDGLVRKDRKVFRSFAGLQKRVGKNNIGGNCKECSGTGNKGQLGPMQQLRDPHTGFGTCRVCDGTGMGKRLIRIMKSCKSVGNEWERICPMCKHCSIKKVEIDPNNPQCTEGLHRCGCGKFELAQKRDQDDSAAADELGLRKARECFGDSEACDRCDDNGTFLCKQHDWMTVCRHDEACMKGSCKLGHTNGKDRIGLLPNDLCAVHIIISCSSSCVWISEKLLEKRMESLFEENLLKKRIESLFNQEFPKLPIHLVQVGPASYWTKNGNDEWRGTVFFNKAICAKKKINLVSEVMSMYGKSIEESKNSRIKLTVQIHEYLPRNKHATK